MNYLSSAFLLYCVGIAISLVTFVIEVVHAHLRKHSSIKVLKSSLSTNILRQVQSD